MRKEILEQIVPEEQKKHDNPHHPSMACHIKRLAAAKEALLLAIYETPELEERQSPDNRAVRTGR